MRRLAVVVVLVVGCGGGGSPATSTGGSPGSGGQLGSGGAAGAAATSTGGSAGHGQAGATGGAAAGASGASGAPGSGGAAGGSAGATAGASGSSGGAAAGGAAGGAGHPAAGSNGQGGAAGGSGPSCGAAPAPSTTCNSLSVDGPCVLPSFVVGTWPSDTFTSGTTPKTGTYQLTAVTYYGAAADAGAGFECEGTLPLRETIEISGAAGSFNLQVAQASKGIALAVQAGSVAFNSSGYSGPPSLPTSYTFTPSCASGPVGTSAVSGGWGATSTTVTLSGFTLAGCMHGGKARSGTEVATFTLVQ